MAHPCPGLVSLTAPNCLLGRRERPCLLEHGQVRVMINPVLSASLRVCESASLQVCTLRSAVSSLVQVVLRYSIVQFVLLGELNWGVTA